MDFNFENGIKELVKRYMESWKIIGKTEGERAVDTFTKKMIDLKTTVVELSLQVSFSKSLKMISENKQEQKHKVKLEKKGHFKDRGYIQ